MPPEFSATLIGLAGAYQPDDFVTEPRERLELGFEGIEGDRHAGLYASANVRQKHHPKGTQIRNFRQLSILGVEELDQVRRSLELPELRAEWLGGNLLLQGVAALTRLPASSRLLFPSGACVAIDDENEPCINPGKVLARQYPDRPNLASRFVKEAMGLRGLVGWVERPGAVLVGDAIRIVLPFWARERRG